MSKKIVKINGERCKGCGLCIAVCPKKILVVGKSAPNGLGYYAASLGENSGECIGCANCALMCPDGAISIYEE